jgi:hypothetical protein
MSVIIQLATFTAAQGWYGTFYNNVTNSGNENVENIKLKVVDSAVYNTLTIVDHNGTFRNCLNSFNDEFLRIFDLSGAEYSAKLAAGTTKRVRFTMNIKAAAPVQVHNLTCDFTYTVY